MPELLQGRKNSDFRMVRGTIGLDWEHPIIGFVFRDVLYLLGVFEVIVVR
jgi:hypothetical protein